MLFAEVTSSADIPVDAAEIDDILTWISNGEFRGCRAGGDVCTEWLWESWRCPCADFLPFSRRDTRLSHSR